MDASERLLASSIEHRRRFETAGDPQAINEAVRLGQRALEASKGRDAARGVVALELSKTLGTLHDAYGDDELLRAQLECLAVAQRAFPRGHEDMPAVYGNLCATHLRLFELERGVDDLEAAVEAGRLAVELAGPESRTAASKRANLAGALRTRFLVAGQPADLDESVAHGAAAVATCDPAASAYAMASSTFAASLLVRFGARGARIDLDTAISSAEAAVAGPAVLGVHGLIARSILVSSLLVRFEASGSLRDLSAAIYQQRAILAAADQRQPEYPIYRFNLAKALQLRFTRVGSEEDLDEALDVVDETVHPAPGALAGLSLSLAAICRYTRSALRAANGDVSGAEHEATAAMRLARRALAASDARDPGRVALLLTLGNASVNLYNLTKQNDSRLVAIGAFEDALDAMDENHTQAVVALCNLGYLALSGNAEQQDPMAAGRQFRQALERADSGTVMWAEAATGLIVTLERDGTAEGAVEAVETHRRLVALAALAPEARMRSGAAAGALLMRVGGHAADAAQTYADAVATMPIVAWHGGNRRARERRLAEMDGLAGDAAASLLATGKAWDAVKALEQGRNLILAGKLALRTEDAELWGAHPDVATRLRDISAALDAEPSLHDGPDPSLDQRVALAHEWDDLVTQIRELDGFSSFLRPPSDAHLREASVEGPIALLNISRWGCSAITISECKIRTIALDVTPHEIAAQCARYLKALQRATTAPDRTERVMVDVLGWLWDRITAPVLSDLGFHEATSTPPRLWWCPTGRLAMLPLHAAGHYDDAGMARQLSAMDRVVSSYTPTLRALVNARTRRATRPHDVPSRRFLVVTAASTPHHAPLSSVSGEGAMVKHRIGDRADVLDGASASRTAVLAALENRSGIHFACHGSMDLDHPAQSGLSLHDHVLTIADLAGLRESADFAYLSACRTATGSSHLPDETMTLAAALHYAGFAHVIGSLSGIADRAAADVAESVYGRMIDSHGFDPDRAPRALHEALQEHRRRSSPLRTWTAFTHTGP